jgi:thiol-disulfide isomerase/thioredoxin
MYVIQVTFSATWCGPCKATKPRLEEVAKESSINFGYVYESDLEPDFFDVFVEIKAFPTYVIFKNGQEAQRVEGTDFDALQQMLSTHSS